MKTTTLHRIIVANLMIGMLAGCGTAPALNQPTLTKESQSIQAKGVAEDIQALFYGNATLTPRKGAFGDRFVSLLVESCNPSLDTTRKLQIRLEMMEIMDQTFAGILSIRKPAVFGANLHKLAVSEAQAGRQCYSEFQKNRDQLKAAEVHRDMLRHLVNIMNPVTKLNQGFMGICVKPSMFAVETYYFITPDGGVLVNHKNKVTRIDPFKN